LSSHVKTLNHLLTYCHALPELLMTKPHAPAELKADEMRVTAPFRDKSSPTERASPGMKIGHPDRAHHAGKLANLFQFLDRIAFDPRLRPRDDFYVRHRPLITRFSSECNEQSGFQGRRPNVFSDRQPGELVALF